MRRIAAPGGFRLTPKEAMTAAGDRDAITALAGEGSILSRRARRELRRIVYIGDIGAAREHIDVRRRGGVQ